jgi:hypothetical protein
MLSRRGFASLALALFSRPAHSAGREGADSQQTPAQLNKSEDKAEIAHMRWYRADAAILLLGMTVYKREGVGGGRASVEETGEGAAKQLRLFFAAGSDPKRAHGLSRLGWIRESVSAMDNIVTEASYFGVLTSSPEESLEHARQAVNGPQTGTSLYSAVNGRNTVGHSRSAITHFEYSTGATWSDQRLIDEAQSTFHPQTNWRESAWPDKTKAPSSFLLELATLLKRRQPQTSGRYVYNEQEYAMEVEMPQPHAGKDGLLAIHGRVRNLRTGRVTPFQLWLDGVAGSVAPVRIVFQPRSFLRLTFEAVPAIAA